MDMMLTLWEFLQRNWKPWPARNSLDLKSPSIQLGYSTKYLGSLFLAHLPHIVIIVSIWLVVWNMAFMTFHILEHS